MKTNYQLASLGFTVAICLSCFLAQGQSEVMKSDFMAVNLSAGNLNAENPFKEILSIAPTRNITAIYRYEYLKGEFEPRRFTGFRTVFYLNASGLADSAKYYRNLGSYCEYVDYTHIFEYSESGLLHSRINKRLNFSSVSGSGDGCEFNFDGDRMIVRDTAVFQYTENGFPKNLDRFRNYSYVYDSANRRVTRFTENTDPFFQRNTERLLIALNSNDQIDFIEHSSYQYEFLGSGVELLDSTTVQVHFEYSTEGRLSQKMLHSWDTLKKSWNPAQKTEIIYDDEKGSWDEIMYQKDKLGDWFLTHKTSYYTQKNYPLNFEEPTPYRLFPNPAQNELHIESHQNISGRYHILDLAGTQVLSGDLKASNGQNFTLNIENLASGHYLLNLISGKHPSIHRFIKK